MEIPSSLTSSTNSTIEYNDLDISRNQAYTNGSMNDLREKYGVVNDTCNSSLPDEIVLYRRKKIRQRRILVGAVVITGLVLIYGLFKLIF